LPDDKVAQLRKRPLYDSVCLVPRWSLSEQRFASTTDEKRSPQISRRLVEQQVSMKRAISGQKSMLEQLDDCADLRRIGKGTTGGLQAIDGLSQPRGQGRQAVLS
jgi:hypothetical protein